jgi:hypothetical protein
MRFRQSWFEVALVVVFLSATLYAAFSDAYNLPNRWFIRDDAYYYFKVAQNISEGHGSTFDGIHATNGYHPLWLLICIPIFALARYDLILPLRILAILSGVLQIGTAILLYRLVRRAVSEPAGILAACFWAFNSYVLVFLYKTGVESIITLFLVLALLYSLYKFEVTWRTQPPTLVRIAGMGALAALIAFGRLDLIFYSLVVGFWIVLRSTPMRYLLPLDVLAIVIAVVAAFLTRLGFAAYYDVANSVVIMLIAALVCRIPAFYLLGLYEPPSGWKPLSFLGRILLATAAGTLVLAAVLLAGSAAGLFPGFSRVVLLLDAAFTLGLLVAIRASAFLFRSGRGAAPPYRPLTELRSSGRRWLTEGGVYYAVVGGSMALYMLWNRLAFGTFSPVSGQIKHWWGTFTHSIYGSAASSWLTFFALNPFSDFNAWAPPTTTLSDWSNRLLYHEGTGFGNPRWQANFLGVLAISALIVMAIPLLKRKPVVRAVVQTGMIPLFVGSWLQILAYNVTGYASPKEWYWLLQPIFLVLAAAVLVKVVSAVALDRWRLTRIALWVAVAWYGVHGAFVYWRDAYALHPYGLHAAGTAYSPVIPFLEANTEPGAVIGMTGGGNVAYLMPGRTIVNMDGLINSFEYYQALRAGTGADYLYDTGLRYVFANPTLLAANPYRGQYADRLELLVDWGGKDLLRLLPEAAH